MESFTNFFNSNFFIGLITLIVGGAAVLIYQKQKRDKKREAARLILQEIRYAEQEIRNFRNVSNYQFYVRLLPTNSWNENIHLFVKDLEEHEIDMISSFYAKARYIDYLIETRSQQSIEHAVLEKMPAPGTPLPVITPNPQDIAADALLKRVSASVEFIHNTPVVEKLRFITKKKWYQKV